MKNKQMLMHKTALPEGALMTNGVAIDVSNVPKSSDGALILNAKAMRTGDYQYVAFEISGSAARGHKWDEILTGRMEKADVQAILPQFKALPMTDEHEFVKVGERAEHSCGTVLAPGKMKGKFVNTECVVHDPKTIMKITSGEASELSIGFYSIIEWVDNPQKGDPDFYIREIDLNHLAVVREGRAGPDARLSNHKAILSEETAAMKKIMINGVEVEVSEVVYNEIIRLQNAETASQEAIATVTNERDLAQGQIIVLNKKIEGGDQEAIENARQMANEHATFIDEATRLGHDTSGLELGGYDRTETQIKILNGDAFNYELENDAAPKMVDGVWIAALKNAKSAKPQKQKGKNSSSALDGHVPPQSKSAVEHQASAQDRINQSYFGGGKKKKAE